MMNRGRGRGINNAPAWMNQQQQHSQGPPGPPQEGPPPPSSNHDAYGRPPPPSHHHNHHHRPYDDRPHRGGYNNHDRRGPPHHHRGGYRSRGDNPPPFHHHHHHRGGDRRGGPRRNGGGGSQALPGMPQFTSMEDERTWVEDRRRARQQRQGSSSKFDILPDPSFTTTSASTSILGGTTAMADPSVLATANAAAAALAATLPAQQNAVPTQTRHARRLYIGNLPHPVNEPMIHDCFVHAIRTAWVDAATLPHEDPILSVYINHERRFAFVEFKHVSLASACMNLDGLMLQGVALKIKRPNDYNEWTATQALQGQPIPELDVSRLGIISGNVLDGPNKIFIGGLHYHLTEQQVLELLQAFGKIKAFHLVKSGDEAIGTNNLSKGYCFVEYADPNVTATAIQGLNGMDIGGGKSLTARLAGGRPGAGLPTVGATATTTAAMPGMPDSTTAAATSSAAATNAPLPPGAPPPDRNIVQGYDIEHLVDAAMGQCPMPTAPTYTDALGMPLTRIVQLFAPALPAAVLGGPTTTTPALPPLPAATTLVPPQQAPPNTPSSRILVLHNMVQPEDLATDQDHQALTDEVRDECAKYGRILSMKIPRQASATIQASAVGKIFLEYASVPEAAQAQEALQGRQFGDAVVQVTYCDEGNYAAEKLE